MPPKLKGSVLKTRVENARSYRILVNQKLG